MPLPRFDKLSAEKQSAILDAALEEFARSGFDGASFNQIIARAGVSKGAIYYYFADKEDLYLTVLERSLADLASLAQPPTAQSAADYWIGVEQIYRNVIALMSRDARVVRLLKQSAADLMRLTQSARLQPLMNGLHSHTEQFLRRGQALGAVRSDLELELLLALTFAVGETLDHHMIASGALETREGAERSLALGMDTLRRLLAPAK